MPPLNINGKLKIPFGTSVEYEVGTPPNNTLLTTLKYIDY